MADEQHIEERLFEMHDGKSDKFWIIELSGTSHAVRYGRVGTDGQTKTKDFADEAKASYDKLVDQKVKKGYSEVTSQGESRNEQVKAAREELKLQEPFLKEIQANPDDPTAYGVFADWLVENGNPLGEFIQVQMQLEDESLTANERSKLKKTEKALLKTHEREWMGDLAPQLIDKEPDSDGDSVDYTYSFERGFLASIEVPTLTENFGRNLAKSSACSMLSRLTIDYIDWEFAEEGGLELLAKCRFDNLRTFEVANGGESVFAEGLESVVKKMPNLQVLGAGVHSIDLDKLFALKLPRLRSLEIDHQSDEYPLKAIAKNKSFENLESISFLPHALEPGDSGAYISREGFIDLCKSKNLKKLTHLRLQCSDIGNDGLKELVKSPLLGQLKVLDLTYGCVTDEGADVLAGADLSNLNTLSLEGNYISKEAIARLRKSAPSMTFVGEGGQYNPSNMDEREDLYNGDWE